MHPVQGNSAQIHGSSEISTVLQCLHNIKFITRLEKKKKKNHIITDQNELQAKLYLNLKPTNEIIECDVKFSLSVCVAHAKVR